MPSRNMLVPVVLACVFGSSCAKADEITSLVTARLGSVGGGWHLSFSGGRHTAHFSPDGRYLFTTSRGRGQIWSVPDLKPVKAFYGPQDYDVPAPLYDPQMRMTAVSISGQNPVTQLLALPGWRLQKKLEGITWGDEASVSQDGRFVAWRQLLWTLPEGTQLTSIPPSEGQRKRLPGGKKKVRKDTYTYILGFCPTRPLLATLEYMAEDELNLHPELENLVVEHRKASGNPRYMATQIALWSVPDAKRIVALPGAHELVGFDLDGNIATYGPKGGVYLWSVPEGQPLAKFGDDKKNIPKSQEEFVHGAMSSDGRFVAYANAKGTRVWPSAGGEPYKIDSKTRSGFSMRFSPDARVLATFSDFENSCRLWSVPSGKLLATLSDRSVGQAVFSPDGRILATNEQGQVALWLFAPGDKLDWSPSDKNPDGKPKVTLTARKFAYPGDEFWLDLTVRNLGEGDLTQLWADARGESPQINRIGCVLGRVKAGTTVERRMTVILPADHAPGTFKGTLSLRRAGNTEAVVAQPFFVEIKPLPRPDFTLLAKPAEVRIKRGQKLEVPVFVSNQTGEALPKLRVSIKVLGDNRWATLNPASLDFGTMATETKAEQHIEITANKDVPGDRITFEMRAADSRQRMFGVQQFVLRVRE